MHIVDYFYLDPQELHNVNVCINKKIQEKCQDHCSQEIGYITGFNGINKIFSNIVNRNGNKIVYKVVYDVECFKPHIDSEYNAEIKYIFEDGIVLLYYKMKILIPKNNLIENGYVFENNTYGDFKVGDYLDIIITQIKYEKNNFMCIANLKL
jgi:DNA-directed RNA polymerase subunit E'/Rpb7